MDRLKRTAIALCLTLLTLAPLISCQTLPRYQTIAAEQNYSSLFVQGGQFSHQLFFKPGHAHPLHVYIEGDGTPWLTRTQIARDPTPRNPLMLELMALDSGPALYLGRPCYFQKTAVCSAQWWTGRRYSAAVVESMNTVLDGYRRDYDGIVIVGHSGGGTLAMLLAEQPQAIRAVVTLAANLDVAAWTQHHRYTPLSGSLDPAQRPPLDATIKQFHYLGSSDPIIKEAWLRNAVNRQANATLRILPGIDHRNGWQKKWPELIHKIDADLADNP